ncbi:hypothetical protein BT69DRAFT_1317903 [Atractiella rhizophila]|nr:hypothetical protein BT69DRAFT_1317903 [Atractiella rhizophila]
MAAENEKGLPAPATAEKKPATKTEKAVNAVKRWGAFRISIVLGVLALFIFLILLFAACNVLPSFISEHCTDNGTTDAAAVGKRALDLGRRGLGVFQEQAAKIGTLRIYLHLDRQ